ncbi:MAG: DUF4279 domain-containing protein [Planctomycetes bacterium]|nr:DUF4279 domain-containing protein [Planctomycetota bacterium]
MNNLPKTPHAPRSHSYTVELRFTGDGLSPTEVSQLLSLQPHNSSTLSEKSSSGRRRRPFWAYKGHGVDGFQPEWDSLEAGLSFLLRQLAPHRAAVINLSQSFEGIWWCGHFQASFDGGPTLSAALLAELASFGLPLAIDNYFADQP